MLKSRQQIQMNFHPHPDGPANHTSSNPIKPENEFLAIYGPLNSTTDTKAFCPDSSKLK